MVCPCIGSKYSRHLRSVIILYKCTSMNDLMINLELYLINLFSLPTKVQCQKRDLFSVAAPEES